MLAIGLCLALFVFWGAVGYAATSVRDIARALGTVGHVSHLRRTRAGPFTLEQAVSLDFLTELERPLAVQETRSPQVWLLCLPKTGPNQALCE